MNLVISKFTGLLQNFELSEIRLKGSNSVVLSRRVLEHFAYFHDTEAARGRHGHDRVVVGFTTTYAIGAYHH